MTVTAEGSDKGRSGAPRLVSGHFEQPKERSRGHDSQRTESRIAIENEQVCIAGYEMTGVPIKSGSQDWRVLGVPDRQWKQRDGIDQGCLFVDPTQDACPFAV